MGDESMAQIDVLFQAMVERKSSDLMIAVGAKPVFKVSGEITYLDEFGEVTPEDAQVVFYEIMPARNREEFDKINDTDFAYELKGAGRFRCNIFRNRLGMVEPARGIPLAAFGLRERQVKVGDRPDVHAVLLGSLGKRMPDDR